MPSTVIAAPTTATGSIAHNALVHSARSTDAPASASGSLLAALARPGTARASRATATQHRSTVTPIEPTVLTRRFDTSRARSAKMPASTPVLVHVSRAVWRAVWNLST